MNLTILDVVKKEVTKLLGSRIIYPISDIQWVSPVQVIPKKSRMVVMKNQHDELGRLGPRQFWGATLARIIFLYILLIKSWKN
ncbi:hypothetical protein CR513_14525, partial [Mucuna pruriens]